MKRFFFLIIMVGLVASCSQNDLTIPPVNADANLANTHPISLSTMQKMEGIYELSDGDGGLGSSFVCKTSRFKISFFSNLNGTSIILKYGRNSADGSIQFSGFWRVTEGTSQGLANFSISSTEGASDFLLNGLNSNIVIRGTYRDSNGGGARDVVIKFKKEFSDYAKNNPFLIFGHHGISTTANPPYAENSLNAARYAEDYGLTGIEYDIRLTKDNVPICIHDPSINIRLTLKGPLAGSYDTYNFNLLRQHVDLIDGQKIPSVAEVLDVVIYETNLKHVWLDIKGNENVFAYLEPVVRTAYVKAAAVGRDDLVIFAGLPTEDVITELGKQPSYKSGPVPLPTLAELSIEDVIATNSSFFGPRYSEGLLLEDVEQAHSMGVKVISWTLNDRKIITNYMQNGQFDGFITDYPAYVVYDFYTMF